MHVGTEHPKRASPRPSGGFTPELGEPRTGAKGEGAPRPIAPGFLPKGRKRRKATAAGPPNLSISGSLVLVWPPALGARCCPQGVEDPHASLGRSVRGGPMGQNEKGCGVFTVRLRGPPLPFRTARVPPLLFPAAAEAAPHPLPPAPSGEGCGEGVAAVGTPALSQGCYGPAPPLYTFAAPSTRVLL
ncbi:hypothetical protein P7K49_032128 [Saguinus oedipus]|uniref:Uncharacterized protein n=1 Tax=Saguinus oedipus TaxID=9490 RepID=A0ABQ9TXD3_SAGOE|nr:hypothetical protein P7K49_032128 [Saguinus oedipus]